jgi:hypothetical protein
MVIRAVSRSRRRTISTLAPGANPPTADSNSFLSMTARPLTLTTTSPARRLAFAAGLPLSTSSTTAPN